MKISFTQIYIEPSIHFGFSHFFQIYLSEKITELSLPSAEFIKKWGEDYELNFYISAKEDLDAFTIKGPQVDKKAHVVEFTLFLPYSTIVKTKDVNQKALEYIFDGIYTVFDRYKIDTRKIVEQKDIIINHVMKSPKMFRKLNENV